MKSVALRERSTLAVILLILTEILFFASLISAYFVTRINMRVWPPEDQPRLPTLTTLINTIFLIISGILLFIFSRRFPYDRNKTLLHIATICGFIFILRQGSEWINLINYGLTISSSIYGSFFYLIVGAHGIHAIAGITMLTYLALKPKNTIRHSVLKAISLYWYFVVLIWPPLYILVYIV